jgi:hypothetical protein
MPAPAEIHALVERFEANLDSYRGGAYNETLLRRDFLDPMFKALGWDMDNAQGYAEAFRDVVHEDAIKVGGSTKAPDYSFRIGGRRIFFLEAKKPSVFIKEDVAPAYQLRRYAWSADLPLSVLSDFEEFAVYDCRVKPALGDKAAKGRVLYLTFRDYIERWDEIAGIFSKEAVLKGSFDRYAREAKGKRGTTGVDGDFLAQIEGWRETLAKNIALRNNGVGARELNFAVQTTIDRIVFLRICEDRGIEPLDRLRGLTNGTGIYARLSHVFREADDRYNSGLFHFRTEKHRAGNPDEFTLGLKIDDKVLKDLILGLYYPESPYEFSVLPADILGQVYERFLGSVIRLTAGGQAKVEEKPEVKKAGGVYYTPTYIVDYIVGQTVGRLCEGKAPRDVAKLRVLDPACGSGSFLIGAYQYLLDWHLKWYADNEPERHAKGKEPKVHHAANGWRLTASERKRILTNNIYGVDIDAQAVEVSKLSLLLKVLEGETDETLNAQMRLFHERALPDLDGNIKCGNSLIGPDFFDGRLDLDEEERRRINAFDWQAEFANVFKVGGFDVVIGNPPYVDSEWMTYSLPDERQYCTKRYEAASGNWDLFCVFIEKAVALCRSAGFISLIVPNKLGSASYAAGARKVATVQNCLLSLRDFAAVPVFPVSVYPIVFVVSKNKAKNTSTVRYEKMSESESAGISIVRTSVLAYKEFFANPEKGWAIFSGVNGAPLLARLSHDFPRLDHVATVLGAATVSEAYRISPLLRDDPVDDGLKFVNSGTIDRYAFLWGSFDCRYIKRRYSHPYLSLSDLEGVSFKRAKQAQTPKIIVAGMTKILECGVDIDGRFVAGKSTTVIFSITDLRYLAGILNSRLVNFYYDATFGGDKLAGGYLRVGPPQLATIPLAMMNLDMPRDRLRHDRMVAMVNQMLQFHEDLASARTAHEKTLLERQIAATDRQIDTLVYELYGLTGDEIAIVEGSVNPAL